MKKTITIDLPPMEKREGGFRFRVTDPVTKKRSWLSTDSQDEHSAIECFLKWKYGNSGEAAHVGGTCSQLLEPFEKEQRARIGNKRKGIRKEQCDTYVRQLRYAASFFGENTLVSSISKLEQIEPYVQHLSKYKVNKKGERGVSDSSVNEHLTSLGLGFELAIDLGWATTNPVSKYGRLVLYNCVDIVFTPREIFTLMDLDIPESTKMVIAFGCFAGLRLGEILGLKWRNVELNSRMLNIIEQWEGRPPKWGSRRHVPISKYLEPFLSRKVISLSPNVVTKGNGEHFTSRNTFRSTFWELKKKGRDIICRAVERAGYEDVEEAMKTKFETHSFRHTFATLFLNATGNEVSLSSILGHSRKEREGKSKARNVTLRYAVTLDKTNAEQMAKFDRYIQDENAAELYPICTQIAK